MTRPNNPANFECEKSANTIHTWKRLPNGQAQCVNCKLVLSVADAAEVFYDYETKTRQ